MTAHLVMFSCGVLIIEGVPMQPTGNDLEAHSFLT